jgi:hypothetical protein
MFGDEIEKKKLKKKQKTKQTIIKRMRTNIEINNNWKTYLSFGRVGLKI